MAQWSLADRIEAESAGLLDRMADMLRVKRTDTVDVFHGNMRPLNGTEIRVPVIAVVMICADMR